MILKKCTDFKLQSKKKKKKLRRKQPKNIKKTNNGYKKEINEINK